MILVLVSVGFVPNITGFCTPPVSYLVPGFAVLFGVFFIVVISLVNLFWTVRTQESRTARWSVAGTGAASSRRLRGKAAPSSCVQRSNPRGPSAHLTRAEEDDDDDGGGELRRQAGA